ncbi:S53 family peptidase [Ramlibacter sp. MMS24-I3-19]|uniref:S53 family peptidase n=1 Tax=Ramlibacter sp. MMS24-I3-19 TaxID=3416606 RepID=UPI003D000153
MRKAYELDGFIERGYDGAGQTIVIVDAFQHPNLHAQMDSFDSYYGLPAVQLSQVAPDGLTPFDPADPVMVGWAEEISLDVEWAHAMAPGAKIVLVLAKTSADSDMLSAIRYAVDNNLGNVISMSFGANENCVDAATHRAYHQVFAQATRKHMTLLASSADQGAALPSCDGNSWEKAVSSPANDPLVTAVGGTELRAAAFCLSSLGCDPATNPAPGTWQSEIVWNEGPKYGDFGEVFAATGATGGGYSSVFDAPKYQKASIRGLKQRAVPDVAYNAAVLHGVLVRLDIPGPAWRLVPLRRHERRCAAMGRGGGHRQRARRPSAGLPQRRPVPDRPYAGAVQQPVPRHRFGQQLGRRVRRGRHPDRCHRLHRRARLGCDHGPRFALARKLGRTANAVRRGG